METKRHFRYFTIAEYEDEENYLRSMHKQGWKFIKVNGLGLYHFEKCNPEDVVYQLDYNQEGIKHKEEYIQMFQDCGWTYLQDYFGYSYFSKPATQKEANSIFCDDESRLDMMNRVFRGRVLSLIFIFLGVLIPQFVNMVSRHEVILTIFIGAIILIYLFLFINFARSYHKLKNKIRK